MSYIIRDVAEPAGKLWTTPHVKPYTIKLIVERYRLRLLCLSVSKCTAIHDHVPSPIFMLLLVKILKQYNHIYSSLILTNRSHTTVI